MRNRNNPSAAMTERKTIHRVTRSLGVVAVSLSDGIANCGGGPGLGPTANVNAPRTGWPSTEMTRQKTRYQPDGTGWSGTTSWSAFVAERRGGPAVTCRPAASVTETIANLGSTGSLYVSRTSRGGLRSVTLADGDVCRSAACANADAGSASATPAAAASARTRLTRSAAL